MYVSIPLLLDIHFPQLLLDNHFLQHYLLGGKKNLPFYPLNDLETIVIWKYMQGFISGCSIIALSSLSLLYVGITLLLIAVACLSTIYFGMKFWNKKSGSFTFVFYFRIVVAIWRLLRFHMKFRMNFSISLNKLKTKYI